MPVQSTYRCTQQNLYTLCRLAWNTVTTYLVQFTAFSPMYVALFITGKLAAVDAAEALPDEEARIEDSRILRVNMSDKATEGRDLWQRLKRYILKAFPKSEQEIRLNAAGQAHYAKAGNDDWEAVKRLLLDGDAFITANSVALLAGSNMPPTFAATFTTAKTDFNTLYEDYLTAAQTDEVETQTKIEANNVLHSDVMSMFLDGQEIFKNDEAIKKLFTFDQVLLTVAGPGTTGLKGLLKNSFTNLPITETGATIRFIGTGIDTITDGDGRYEKVIAAGTYTLEISCTGYITQTITGVEISTGIMRTLNITLVPAP